MKRHWYDKVLHLFTHLAGAEEPTECGNIMYWDCRVCGKWMGLRGTFTVVAPPDEI